MVQAMSAYHIVGSLARADTSLPPDIYYGVPTDSPAFGQIGLEGIPAEVWTYALARLKLTVTDAGSGKPVWTARASERIQYPKNALKNLRTSIDDFMAKTLKSFPPASKSKSVHSDEAFSRTSRIREETVAP